MKAIACAAALALLPALDASAQFRSPAQVAAPRGPRAGESCRLNTRPLDFGGYEDGSPAGVLTTATIDLNCRSLTSVPIVSAGPSANTGYYEDRQLAYRDSRLRYQVYINPQRTIIWGDGTGQTQPVTAIGTGDDRSFTVYGGIFQAQSGEVGRYSDTLQVTVVP
jgi:spore coat protein U-like protein